MNKFTFHLIAVLVCIAFGTSIAQAQANRTWVSGTGDDANPCSRTAPCKTFAGAISKTAINGEIDAMDPGGYGTVTITKSMTLDGTGTFAAIASPIGSGIAIVFTTSDTQDPVKSVRIRGLSITGGGSSTCGGLSCGTRTGIRGIFVSPSSLGQPKLIVQDTVIDGFTGDGILFTPNGGDLVVSHTVIRNNDGAGIKLDTGGANIVHATIDNSMLILNGDGLRVEDAVRATVKDSSLSNNAQNGLAAINLSASSQTQILHSMIAENRQNGIQAGGNITFATVQVAESMIVHNNVGVAFSNANGRINSWGNNYVSLNGSDGTFSTSSLPLR